MKGKDKLKKQEEEEKEPMEGEEDEEKSAKSEDLTEDDLEKSLSQLEAEVGADDPASRKDQLLEKAKSGDLEKSEQDELYKLLGGETQEDEDESLSDEVSKGFEENDEFQKALDVSPYIREQHAELTKSLEVLSDRIEQDGNRQHQFNIILAKAVADTGRLVKSLAEQVGVVAQQPARAPKAKRSPVAEPIEKGFAGQPPAGDELSKSEILDTLEVMINESMEKGMAGNTEDGIDLTVAASKVEQFGQIHPQLLARVKAHRARGGATVQ